MSITQFLFRSAAGRLFLCAGLASMLFHSQAEVVAGYYQGGSADSVPPKTLVTNGSAAEITHLIYAFATIQANPGNTNLPYSCSLSGNLNTAQGKYNNSGAYYAIQEEYAAGRSVSGTGDSHAAPNPYIGPNDPGYSSQPPAPTVLQGNFHQFQEMKAKYPNLKILVSIGGADGSANFSNAAKNPASFAQSCVSMFINGNFGLAQAYPGIFNGFDIDWEYPANTTDEANYTALLAAFQNALTATGKTYTLTATMGPSANPDGTGFINIPAAAAHLDYVNVMTYDYEPGGGTAFNAPMYGSEIDPNSPYNITNSPWFTYNVNATMNAFVTALGSTNKGKLLVGIPFYGIQWSGVTDTAHDHGMFEQATFVAQPSYASVAQKFAFQPGFTKYCDYGNTALPYSCATDSGTAGAQEPWLYDGSSTVVTYDDEAAVATKVKYAENKGLGGVLVWDLSQDSPGGCLMSAIWTSVSSTNKPINQDTALYNFEAGAQGWTNAAGNAAVGISEGQAYAGCRSLGVNFTDSSALTSTAYVLSPSIKPGQTITLHIWIPAGSHLSSVNPFITNTSWTWLASSWTNASSLPAGQWNTISFTVPTNAPTTFGELGVQFTSNEAWAGTVYIDSVNN